MIEEAIAQCIDLWEQCFRHPFLEDMRRQALPQEMFLHYLIEDTKYLKDYARVFGMGVYKSTSMKEITLFYDMLKFVEANEGAARVLMLKQEGYDVEALENKPQETITKAYTDFLLQTAETGSTKEMLFATLPCMLSYAYIGKRWLAEDPDSITQSPYRLWIDEYTCQAYRLRCQAWIQQTNALCETVDAVEKQHLFALFHTASVHELRFWDMSYQWKGR